MKILNQLSQDSQKSGAEEPRRIGPTDLESVDVGKLRSQLEKIAADRGGDADEMWRSLEELSGDADFQELVDKEFPRYAPGEWQDGVSRRGFVQLAGASLGLAGLTACTRQPRERIIPYIEQPENLVPGKPLYYASAMTVGGYGIGVIAESQMGRPDQAGRQHRPSLECRRYRNVRAGRDAQPLRSRPAAVDHP